MNFENLYTDITNIISRPELTSHIYQRCVQAVRSIHSIACFPRDHESIVIPQNDIIFGSNGTLVGNFSLPQEIRLVDTIQPLDITGAVMGNPLEVISLSELHDRKLLRQDSDTCYVSNGNVNFRSSRNVTNGLIITGYVYRPPISLLTSADGSRVDLTSPDVLAYNSWLMNGNEAAVIDFVMGYVAKSIGETALANYYTNIWNTLHRESILNLSTTQGS